MHNSYNIAFLSRETVDDSSKAFNIFLILLFTHDNPPPGRLIISLILRLDDLDDSSPHFVRKQGEEE